MYKHECYKLFSAKGIYVILLLIIGMLFFVHSYPLDPPLMEEGIYEKYMDEWGGPVTNEQVSKARAAMEASDAGEVNVRSQSDRGLGYVHYSIVSADINNFHISEKVDWLRSKLYEHPKKSYEYRVTAKELKMVEKLGQPFEFYIIKGWRGMLEFITPALTVVFLVTLLLIGVTPVFADDFSNNRAGLILATKHGKRKLVTAKILAIVTYISTILVFLHGVSAIFAWIKFGGFTGWDVPIHGLGTLESIAMFDYEESPFNLQVWQLYVIIILLQFFGLIALSALIVLISILLKSKMNTMFVIGGIVGVPLMLKMMATERFTQGIFRYISDFNYAELLKASQLFETFKAYNIFGYPILHPTLLVIVFTFITVISFYFAYHRYYHAQITN